MFRICTVCHHSDFQGLLDKVSVRGYRHAAKWAKRCAWFKERPNATLTDAAKAGIPGVSEPEGVR